MGEGSQKVQTSRYKINKSWDVVCNMTAVLIIKYYVFHKVFLHIWKFLRKYLKSAHHKKKILCIVMDVNKTLWWHFTLYANIESSFCSAEIKVTY